MIYELTCPHCGFVRNSNRGLKRGVQVQCTQCKRRFYINFRNIQEFVRLKG